MIAGFRDRLPVEKRVCFDAGMERAYAEGWDGEVKRYIDAYAVAEGCYFDESKCAPKIAFMESHCRHYIGRWRGELFKHAPWQLEISRALFGWMGPNGFRRFRKGSCWVPKKNGKSTYAAALELAFLVADDEWGPEVYTAAVDRKQAGIVHGTGAKMVRLDPELSANLRVINSTKHIICDANDGVMAALSSDVASQEGRNISAAIVDEIHAHKDRTLVTTLMYGGIAREQPLFFAISTAGEYDPTTIGWEEWEYANGVLEGTIEDIRYYACIYAANKEDDAGDPATWRRANPSLGSILKEEDIQADYYEAQKSPSKMADFLRYRLNIWVQTAEAWCDITEWKECRRDFDIATLHGRRVYCAMDLSSNQDLTAFAVCVPPIPSDSYYYLMVYHWIPRDTLPERAQKHDAPYGLWVDRGLIRVTDGNVVDYRRVKADIVEILKPFKVVELLYDPMFAGEIVQDLQAEKIELVEHRQTTVVMSPAMNAFETLMLNREIVHDGNPCFTWQLGNVTIRRDAAGYIAPEKKKNRKKIDGPVSAFMAVGRAVAMTKPKRSVYEDRGVLLF